jgi:LacI family transcriptional regulator
VAFDDVPWMRLMQPGITTVAQPTQELGRTAADLLIDRLTGGGTADGPVVHRLATTLVLRGSTAAPGR